MDLKSGEMLENSLARVPEMVQLAMDSAANLDRGVDDYFKDSEDEAMYRTIKLQPLMFMDDLARISTSRNKAQSGYVKLDGLINTKQLTFQKFIRQ